MPTLERLDAHALRDVITTFRDTVRSHAGGLNRLNVYPVPDGDTGTNMSRTLDAVVAEMEAVDAADLDATCDAISHGSLMGARGNSGVILSQILRGFAGTLKEQAEGLKEHTEGAGARFAEALSAASSSAYQAVLKPIEGTILTVVRESAEAAKVASADGASLADVVRAAREAGKHALDNTPELLPVLKDAGVVDAGGAGYLLLLDSALYVVDGHPLPEPSDDPEGPTAEQLAAVAHRHGGGGEIDVSEQRYEVMYFLDLADEHIEAFKQGWGTIGDSIVVVGGDGLWNCHVHTNDIGAAIEIPLELGGRPKQIRVTDLFEEVAEEHAHREAAMHPGVATRDGAGLRRVTTAVVAVCSGDGLAELFGGLGVQGIVAGGQTLNPSTAELLDLVGHVNADQVVILPNNKNIIPVAEQVCELTTKSVAVVPTRTMPEALAALVVYDPEADVDENVAEMSEAVDAVRSGEVTRAVRDSKADVGPISQGDWMGIVDGDGIVAVGTELLSTVMDLLDRLLTADGELLTVITGSEAEPAVTELILDAVADRHPDVDVEVHRGGQPLYPYLFGVE